MQAISQSGELASAVEEARSDEILPKKETGHTQAHFGDIASLVATAARKQTSQKSEPHTFSGFPVRMSYADTIL